MQFKSLIFFILLVITSCSFAAHKTHRISAFENDRVAVWQTIIYPNQQQILKMHRHERDRVLIALTNGKLKITNDKGKTHYLNLKKNQAYYLAKDVSSENHTDENMSSHPIKVIVIELK